MKTIHVLSVSAPERELVVQAVRMTGLYRVHSLQQYAVAISSAIRHATPYGRGAETFSELIATADKLAESFIGWSNTEGQQAMLRYAARYGFYSPPNMPLLFADALTNDAKNFLATELKGRADLVDHTEEELQIELGVLPLPYKKVAYSRDSLRAIFNF